MESGNYLADEVPVIETNNGIDPEYDLGLDLIISGLEQKIQDQDDR